MQQFEHIANIHVTLEGYFRRIGRSDVLVGGEGYLCRTPGTRSDRVVPDCVVAFGVNPEAITQRNGYVIEEVGRPPDLVLEAGSASTGRRDYTVKRDIYAGFGVTEYWRFDHTGGNFHGVALAGDRLVDGEYSPIPLSATEDGIIWGHSQVLGLDVCWDRGRPRFFNPATGDYLLDYGEMLDARAAAEAHAAAETARANRAEMELQRLREQLDHESPGQ